VFTTRPWVEITQEQMDHFPDDLKVLGCSPSRNAYIEQGLVEQQIEVDPMKTFFRTCGSHLHMSFKYFSEKDPFPSSEWARFISLADLLIGVPFVYLFHDELEKKRRQLYGRAGEFRFQPAYGGLEYRVLSSRLWDHQASYSFLLGMWKNVLGGGNYSRLVKAYDPAWIPEIQQCINEADEKLAKKLLPRVKKVVEAAGAHSSLTGGTSTLFPIEGLLSTLRQKIEEGEIKDCRIWREPWDPDGHTGFGDYMTQWKCPDYGKPRY